MNKILCACSSLLVLLISGCSSMQDNYFQIICHKDAGIKINRVVENVDSIFLMQLPDQYEKRNCPFLYDKLGNWNGSISCWNTRYDRWLFDYPSNILVTKLKNGRYGELTPSTDYIFESVALQKSVEKYVRIQSEIVLTKECQTFFCYKELEIRKEVLPLKEISSKYGFTWREIHPPNFSKRIVGIEMNILEIQSGEVLATAKDYVSDSEILGYGKRGGSRSSCKKPDGSYTPIHAENLILQVLKPPLKPMRKVY